MENELYSLFNRIESTHWWFIARRNIILGLINKFFSINTKKLLVDLGCGTGINLKILQDNFQCVGLDYNFDGLVFTQKKINSPKLLVQGDVQCLPFKKNQVDYVTAFDLLEHLEDDYTGIREIYNILKPGGRAIIFVPAFSFLWGAHDEINLHKRRYTKKMISEKLIASGFNIIKISYVNFFLFPPIALIRISKLLINNILRPKIIKKESDFKETNKILNNILIRIFEIEGALLKFLDLPFGVSVFAIVEKK